MQKKYKQYTALVEKVDLEIIKEELPIGTEDMNIQFSFSFASQNVDVFEEVLIIDEISLIGLLGGSLGLFIGFSFFGYITTFLDAILDKICEWISIG